MVTLIASNRDTWRLRTIRSLFFLVIKRIQQIVCIISTENAE